MNETDTLIAEQLKTLPPNLQQAINAVPWKALVQEIGKTNTLDVEQIISLEQETMLILYGFEKPDNYVPNMVREVGVSEEIAYTIATSAADKIFEPILRKSEELEEPNLIESLHDESGAENIRKILKAHTGEDRDKLIESQLKKLPEALQQAIRVVPWKSVVKEIALLNKLDLAQIVAVERETMFVIYGFENEKNYLSNIMREANLDETIATAITATLNERVFKVIINKVNEPEPPPQKIIASVPEIPPTNLPMIEEGETAHDVPHVEQPKSEIKLEQTKVPLPDYRYPDGKDPYREPLV